jgi:hypothetical protein
MSSLVVRIGAKQKMIKQPKSQQTKGNFLIYLVVPFVLPVLLVVLVLLSFLLQDPQEDWIKGHYRQYIPRS